MVNRPKERQIRANFDEETISLSGIQQRNRFKRRSTPETVRLTTIQARSHDVD